MSVPKTPVSSFSPSTPRLGALAALVVTMCAPVNGASAASSSTTDAHGVESRPVVAGHSAECLDVEGSSTDPNTPVVRRPCDSDLNRQWRTS